MLVAGIGAGLIGTPGACHPSGNMVAAGRSEIEALESAHFNLLELEKCVDRAPDATDPEVVEQRRRTADLTATARSKGLADHLQRAEAKWRRLDSLADKICYFQATDFKGSSAQLLRGANDRFQLAISRF